jgi:hypothetical protein
MSSDLYRHHDYLQAVADEDVRFVLEKDRSYGASWKLAGGRSAWFMLRRKMDRMITMLSRPASDLQEAVHNFAPSEVAGVREFRLSEATMAWIRGALVSEDIFAKIAEKPGGEDGSVLAEVRDLRRYLLLVEAEMIAAGKVVNPKIVIKNPDDPRQFITTERLVPRHQTGDWEPGAEPGHDGTDRA